ncbi:MAG: ABC transporter substrate-binding protein [Chloroflexales bacterium]|nr:ABC transporter substrate-binding protein [Chloroflexales bacterium]
MKIHIFTLFILLAFLSACSGQPAAQEPGATGENTNVAADQVVVESESSDAAKPLNEQAAAADCTTGTRAITHDFGTACVPENPQRIAVMDLDIAAFMRVLDIEPVALSFPQWNELVAASPEWDESGEAFIADAIDIGIWPHNIESIATSNPDLILAAGVEDYDLLSEIAPTVAFDIYNNNENRWSTFTKYFGNVLNVSDEAQTLIDATNDRIATLGDYIVTEAGNPIVSVVQEWEGTISYGAPYFAYNQIMAQADIARPNNQDLTQAEYEASFDEHWANVSLEQLDTIDAEYLLLLSFAYAESSGNVAELREEPIWAMLDAVQNDQFVAVPWQQWLSFDIYSVNKTIDDLFRIVGHVDPAEAAPNPFSAEATDPSLANQTDGEALNQVPGFPAYAPTPTMLEVVEEREETVLVRHAFGQTEVPKNPERVYTDASTTQIALSLGIEPTGAQYFTTLLEVPELAAQLEGVPELGTNTYDPNLEAIAASQPDLIVVWANIISADDGEQRYEQLSQIAPTLVMLDNPFSYWQQATLDLAAAIGDSAAGADALANYEEQEAALCERIRTVIGDGTVSILDVFGSDIRLFGPGITTPDGVYTPSAFTVWAYRDCQLTPGDEVRELANDQFNANLSRELIPQLQADYLISYVNVAGNGQTTYDELTSSPLWNALPAVQQENAIRVEALDASGYYSALYVLEQVANTLEGN